MYDYASAIFRDNWDKHGEIPSLLDFGAGGKGATDDTAAINGAIAQAPRGGMVHIPKGVYAHTGNLVLPKKPIAFCGDGYAQPINWYLRVPSPIAPDPADTGNLGSVFWNTSAGQHFTPGEPTAESFTGNTTTRSWLLTNRANYILDGNVNGTPVTFGLEGETGFDFYLGADRQTITQDVGGATLTGSQVLTINYGVALVDVQITLKDIGFYGGSGVIKIPNMNTSLNFDVKNVIAMYCTGAAFELGEDDASGNAYMSRFNKCYFYNNAIGILAHAACDVNIDDCFFQDHTVCALEIRAANTRITKNTFISGDTGTEDILFYPTGFSTATALYNLRVAHNKFGNENSVSGETRVKIRVGTYARKVAEPFFYVANLDIHDNIFVGTLPLAGFPTACIAIHSPMQNSRIHHNDFFTASYAVDDSDSPSNAAAGNNQYECNQHSFGTVPFKSGGLSFNEISGLDFGLKAVAQPSATDHLLIENSIPASEDFSTWSLFALTVTAGQADPFGGTNAYRLNKTAAYGSVALSSVITSSGPQIFSVWLKAGSTTLAVLEIQDVAFNVLVRQIVGLDSTWRRYTVRLTGLTSGATIVPVIYPDLFANVPAQHIFAFGAQLNSGDEASGYVKTIGTAISTEYGLRAPNDLSVGRDVIVDRNATVSGDLSVVGDISSVTLTTTLAARIVHDFASIALLQDPDTGFGVRLILNNDGTMRWQRTSDGFATIDDTPFRFNASGEIEIQTALKLAAVTVSRPLKVDSGGGVIGAAIDLASSTDVSGELPINRGGTAANTATGARASLSVYSIAEMDVIVATIYAVMAGKALANQETGSSAGHTHTQTP